jgi:glyoxylase-like metal-dependent hydrolase (beta-lactamase superfamily II)
VLFSGDLLQADDVAWLRFEADALEKTVAAVQRLAALDPLVVVPGHGPVVEDVEAAVRQTLDRYATWAGDPARWARHAARRVVITTLVLTPCDEAALARLAWARELARVTETTPAAAVAALVDGHVRAGVVRRDPDGTLRATVAHEPV